MSESTSERSVGGRGGVLGGEGHFEGFQLVEVFLPNDDAVAIEAGLQGVAPGHGLALDGARAGGELRIAAVRRELFFSCHKWKRQTRAGLPLNSLLGHTVTWRHSVTDGVSVDVVEIA